MKRRRILVLYVLLFVFLSLLPGHRPFVNAWTQEEIGVPVDPAHPEMNCIVVWIKGENAASQRVFTAEDLALTGVREIKKRPPYLPDDGNYDKYPLCIEVCLQEPTRENTLNALEILKTLPFAEHADVVRYNGYGNTDLGLGDVDADKRITAADARLALRAAVGLETLRAEEARCADFDFDGYVTAADARLILRYAIGILL